MTECQKAQSSQFPLEAKDWRREELDSTLWMEKCQRNYMPIFKQPQLRRSSYEDDKRNSAPGHALKSHSSAATLTCICSILVPNLG